jgi:hypothetical protein
MDVFILLSYNYNKQLSLKNETFIFHDFLLFLVYPYFAVDKK